MSLTDDVRAEIGALNLSKKALRKFGISVGIAFCVLALVVGFKDRYPSARTILGSVGSLLVVMGLIAPRMLRAVYRSWMALAFSIGWVVSRILLAIVFFVMITPIALLARLTGKEFLKLKAEDVTERSYWVRRVDSKKRNYEKMY
jgi:preprotein translocase subunit SecG